MEEVVTPTPPSQEDLMQAVMLELKKESEAAHRQVSRQKDSILWLINMVRESRKNIDTLIGQIQDDVIRSELMKIAAGLNPYLTPEKKQEPK